MSECGDDARAAVAGPSVLPGPVDPARWRVAAAAAHRVARASRVGRGYVPDGFCTVPLGFAEKSRRGRSPDLRGVFATPARRVEREVGPHAVGAGALEARQGLQRALALA